MNRARVQSYHKGSIKLRPGRVLIHFILFGLSVLFILPLLLVVSASLTDEKAIARDGFSLIPSQFSTFAYQYIFSDPGQILNSYWITVVVTVVGSSLGLLIMALLGYALSRRDFNLRRPLSLFVFFTMLFNGGLVPSYILITQYLHLKNSLPVLILPYLVIPWFVLLLRTYFVGLPTELLEAARIDGAGEWRTFFQIVVPLSKPALATVGLFCILLFWNDWWLALLYIDDKHLTPLQYLLYNLQANIDYLSASPYTTGVTVPAQSARMAMAVLAIGPIIFAFLFVQKHFVRGITLGGIKE